MKALELAGRVAWEELDDPELARRYLERIIDELPTSRNAVQAQELLARLDAGEGPGSKIDNNDPEP